MSCETEETLRIATRRVTTETQRHRDENLVRRMVVQIFSVTLCLCGKLSRYIFPAFMSATRFSKFAVSTLSALPLAMAALATVNASSFLPAAQRMFALVERLRKVSLIFID